MSGRAANVAGEAFVASLQRAVSCVAPVVLVRDRESPGRARTVTSGRSAVRLRGTSGLALSVLIEYIVDEVDGRWLAGPSGYAFEFQQSDGRTFLAYHWHPIGLSPVTAPHLHLGGTLGGIDLSKSHLPTGQVRLQDVLHFAIADLDVEPLRDNWREVLASAESAS